MEDKNKKPQKPNMPLPPFFTGNLPGQGSSSKPAPFAGPSGASSPPGGGPGRLPPPLPGGPSPRPGPQPPAFAGQPQPLAPFQGGKIGAEDERAPAQRELESKLSETEKLLAQEKEKVLMASLKNQEEAVLSAKVETSLKEIQERLRRDKRDQELTEERSGLDARIKELEARLVQERETWMQTLKSQMQQRETQDKDIETHFVFRLQEMERRWLDEKAQWQKAITVKEEEIRSLKAGEKQLADAKDELRKTAFEKESMDREISGMRQTLAQLEKQRAVDETSLRGFSEREKDLVSMKAELSISKARQDNLLSELERLQKDLASASGVHQLEKETALKKMQLSYEQTLQEKESALANAAQDKVRAASEMVRLRASCERLTEVENNLKKAVFEKELTDSELSRMRQALAEIEKQRAVDETVLRSLSEKEKELVSIKAELSALKTREDRLLSEKESALADAARDKIRVISEIAKLRGFVSKIQAVNAVLEKECGMLRLEIKRIRPFAGGGGPPGAAEWPPASRPPPPTASAS